MTVQSFRDLTVWQRGIELTLAIYKLTSAFPREELFGLTSQLRRAAVSIPSNIAEGQARKSTGEFRQFLGIAQGSTAEVQTQLLIARKLGFANTGVLGQCESLATEIEKMLRALAKNLQ